MSSEVLRLQPAAPDAARPSVAGLPPGVLRSPDVQDLVFSYLRLGDPRLKSAAIAAIRAMAQAPRPAR